LFFGPRYGHARFERRGPLTAAARYLGLTDVQLLNELRGGQSLAQVAKEKGKTAAGLEHAMTADFKARLDKAIAAGRITKAQEQTILNRFQSRLDRRVNRTAPRFGGLHAAPDGDRHRQAELRPPADRHRQVELRPPADRRRRAALPGCWKELRLRHPPRPDSYRALIDPFKVSHRALL